jgi:ElaB/YqjD/DUF883 family membrane-anchored ribosome-binding protein
MDNEKTKSQFPSTAKDIDNLKQTATDATSELGEVATKHVSRAKDQLHDLAGHAAEEGQEQLEQVKGSLEDVAKAARNYFADRPLVCLGVAFALGVFFGSGRRGSASS